MAGSKQSSQSMDSESEITLGLLNAINENSALTQRSLARDLGIALGLANAYLKRCAKKGLVKVSQVPSNRYAYYLTPKGFSEKSRLTAEYFSQSFKFFRAARVQCSELFALCAERGWHDVMLVGASDLGEIATFCAREHGVRVTGIVDGGAATATFAGLTVSRDMAIVRARRRGPGDGPHRSPGDIRCGAAPSARRAHSIPPVPQDLASIFRERNLIVIEAAMERWYVVHTQPRGESLAITNLINQGLETYLPLHLRRRRHARRTEWVPAPLFPSYLFVQFDVEQTRWRAIHSTFGVRYLVCNASCRRRFPLASSRTSGRAKTTPGSWS